MPKAAPRTSRPQSGRAAPYPPTGSEVLKENLNSHHAIKAPEQDPVGHDKEPLQARSVNVKSRPLNASKKDSAAGAKNISTSGAATINPSSASASASATSNQPASFLDIKLPGEEDDSFPIYESCAQVRRRIKNFLGKDKNAPKNAIPGQFTKAGKPKPYTQSQFCKDCGISPGSLNNFLRRTETMGGGTSRVYPATYAFFEKKRIFEGGKKTSTREAFEKQHPKGYPRNFDPNTSYITMGINEDYDQVMRRSGMGHLL